MIYGFTVDDPTVNAWCMPGGMVVVYTGIMDLTEDDDELAVVMGHEIAHAIARHGNERMSQGLGVQVAMGVLGGTTPEGKQKYLQYIGLGSQLGVLKFSRTHESES
ncbi:MAG: M48 family metallopeptidase, partial [Gammaproteobacteria bacterium]|nr:M48 family metallopeptidase [Gammaproteobacteria bacterium]